MKPYKDRIIERICDDHNVSVEIILGDKRDFELVDIRCIIANVFFNLGIAQTTIASFLNKKDHTTIGNLLDRINDRSDLKVVIKDYTKQFKK